MFTILIQIYDILLIDLIMLYEIQILLKLTRY